MNLFQSIKICETIPENALFPVRLSETGFLHPQSTGQRGGKQAFDRFIIVSLAFLTFAEVDPDSA